MMREWFCAVRRLYLLVQKMVKKWSKNGETIVLRSGWRSYLIYLLIQKMVKKIAKKWFKNGETMVFSVGRSPLSANPKLAKKICQKMAQK
jgi:hypothetical protein